MPLVLDKSITRDSTNTITLDTTYLELNTKSAKIVNDMVEHVESQVVMVEDFISDIDDVLVGHVAVSSQNRQDSYDYKELAALAKEETQQLKIDTENAITNAGMDYPSVARKQKAQFFGVL